MWCLQDIESFQIRLRLDLEAWHQTNRMSSPMMGLNPERSNYWLKNNHGFAQKILGLSKMTAPPVKTPAETTLFTNVTCSFFHFFSTSCYPQAAVFLDGSFATLPEPGQTLLPHSWAHKRVGPISLTPQQSEVMPGDLAWCLSKSFETFFLVKSSWFSWVFVFFWWFLFLSWGFAGGSLEDPHGCF